MITYPIHLVRTYYIGMQIPCLEFPSNYEVTFDRLNTHCKININIRSHQFYKKLTTRTLVNNSLSSSCHKE